MEIRYNLFVVKSFLGDNKMRIEQGKFRVDFSGNDRFVQVLLIDSTILGGTKSIGMFVEKKFKPERNASFTMEELLDLHTLLSKAIPNIKW